MHTNFASVIMHLTLSMNPATLSCLDKASCCPTLVSTLDDVVAMELDHVYVVVGFQGIGLETNLFSAYRRDSGRLCGGRH